MDAQAKKKALFRAKLNAQKKEKRIDSPLVRYNELDQPVCKVCDVVLKSESIWDAHQASRKHREAISNLKANAAGLSRPTSAKTVSHNDLPKAKSEHSAVNKVPEHPNVLPKSQPFSALPPDFFDNNDAKGNKSGRESNNLAESTSYKRTEDFSETQDVKLLKLDKEKSQLQNNNISEPKNTQASIETIKRSTQIAHSEAKKVKGALPEGFFDNKEADLRARGIKPVKPDVKDEYKEFERLIQEDLLEVDDRLEEEEIDAAEMIEEAETTEQKSYREKVELLRKKRIELKEAARSAKRSKSSEVERKNSSHKEMSSSDDDSDENFTVDWRAQHL